MSCLKIKEQAISNFKFQKSYFAIVFTRLKNLFKSSQNKEDVDNTYWHTYDNMHSVNKQYFHGWGFCCLCFYAEMRDDE